MVGEAPVVHLVVKNQSGDYFRDYFSGVSFTRLAILPG